MTFVFCVQSQPPVVQTTRKKDESASCRVELVIIAFSVHEWLNFSTFAIRKGKKQVAYFLHASVYEHSIINVDSVMARSILLWE